MERYPLGPAPHEESPEPAAAVRGHGDEDVGPVRGRPEDCLGRVYAELTRAVGSP